MYTVDVLASVSVLFNEPKLLKSPTLLPRQAALSGFSALQRAEIAEISYEWMAIGASRLSFSALQRAEIAEISFLKQPPVQQLPVSVLFNEPKLLKFDNRYFERAP